MPKSSFIILALMMSVFGLFVLSGCEDALPEVEEVSCLQLPGEPLSAECTTDTKIAKP